MRIFLWDIYPAAGSLGHRTNTYLIFKNKFIYLIYLFLAVLGLCCSARASHCGGFSRCRARALGARAPVVVAHGLSCSVACGIFLDQGLNQCPLHWQEDS